MSGAGSNPSYGTKVTNDPNSSEIEESAGPVASDSLAAESTRQGGGFSENRNSEPMGVSGSNSTLANKNTSGATQLDPAPYAESRESQKNWAEERGGYPDTLGGQAKGLAVENTQGSSSTGGASSNADPAPSYIASQHIRDNKPKGTNLTEGGFDSDDTKNASFNAEIGSKDDPGRLAEDKIQRQNADEGASAAQTRQYGQGVGGDNQYSNLDGETQA